MLIYGIHCYVYYSKPANTKKPGAKGFECHRKISLMCGKTRLNSDEYRSEKN